MNNPTVESLVPKGKGELMSPFELAKRLFDFAEKNLPENAGSRYSDVNGEYGDNPYAKELPTALNSIVADYPGTYYVVSYENRTSHYYAQGSRVRYVILSTVPKQTQSNDIIREIKILEPDASEGLGNILVTTVKDSILNQSRQAINTAAPGEVDSPHGSAKFTYETNPIGDKRLTGLNFERMDEGIFSWQEAQTPVRWLRYLDIKSPEAESTETEYRDLYIIGRHHEREDKKDTRIDVRFKISGRLDNPKNIDISIGLNIGGQGEVLFEDKSRNIRVVFHNFDPWTTKNEVLSMLRQDPNYAFLLEPDIDRDMVIRLLKEKTQMMVNDWNKPSVVFNQNNLEGKKPMEIG